MRYVTLKTALAHCDEDPANLHCRVMLPEVIKTLQNLVEILEDKHTPALSVIEDARGIIAKANTVKLP